jgi:hypothetical protein
VLARDLTFFNLSVVAPMFDSFWTQIVGRSIKERLGEGKGTAVSAAATEGLNHFAVIFREQGGVWRCLRAEIFGEGEGQDGGCVVPVVCCET